MAAELSLVSGVIETRRAAALCWYENTNHGAAPFLYPMEISGGSPLVSDYGRSFATQNTATTISALLAITAGRRCIRTGFHNNVWKNADDRVRDGNGVIVGSATPVDSNHYYFDNSASEVGGAANGRSNVFLDAFMAEAYEWAVAEAQAIALGGATVDYLAFDNEASLDEFKVGSTYQTALIADSRWSTSLTRLSAIINEATSGATPTFSTVSWAASDVAHVNAWKAYMYERRATALNQVVAGFRTVFPQCCASNYADHGRTGVIVNAGGSRGGLTDLNGHLYYQPTIIGDFSAEYAYGWMAGLAALDYGSTYTRALWGGYTNPYHALVWELTRSMAAVQSGRKLMPWTAYMGFDDSHFMLGGYGEAGATDKCPYWEANLAAQALMASVPAFVGDRWYSGLLHWNSRSYGSGNGPTIAAVDQGAKLFKDNGDRTSRTRPGLMQSFKVIDSTGNDGTYTIDYANGGIWFDGTNTNYKVNEAIPSAVADGNISIDCTDAHDALINTVLADLNSHIGTAGPRSVVQRSIYVGETNTAADTEKISNGSPITWVGLRHGNQITYCIVIGRTLTARASWGAQAITGYVDGASQGTVATVSATKSYVYYTRTYSASETLTFKWSQSAPTNLFATGVLTDAGTWTKSAAGTLAADHAVLSPIDGSDSFHLNAGTVKATLTLTPGKLYCVSIYAKCAALSGSCRLFVIRGTTGDDSPGWQNGQIAVLSRNTSFQSEVDGFNRMYVTFVMPYDETTVTVVVGYETAAANGWYCHPQAVQGILPGPIA